MSDRFSEAHKMKDRVQDIMDNLNSLKRRKADELVALSAILDELVELQGRIETLFDAPSLGDAG